MGHRGAHLRLAAGRLQWGRNLTVADGAGQHRCPEQAGAASMGPQLDSCGWAACDDLDAQIELLQWGRNLTVADGGRRAMRQGASLFRFNGAAT